MDGEDFEDLLRDARVEHRELRDVIVYLCRQFCTWSNGGLSTGGLSALEEAFAVLGIVSVKV